MRCDFCRMHGLNEVVGLCRMSGPNEMENLKMHALNEMVRICRIMCCLRRYIYVVLDAGTKGND